MEPERVVAPPPWIGHIPFAFWIIDAMRPKRFVELGTHSGNSYCAFLQAADAIGLKAEFFAVDHWLSDEHTGLYGESVFDELKAYHDTRYGRFSTLMRLTFDDALPYFDDKTIDLLHIDGLHTYDAVAHDFESCLPKMSGHGVILLHDTNVTERNFGVHRLFAEVKTRYQTFEFFHSHGLGVIYVGAEPPEGLLAALLNDDGSEGDINPHLYFERLGQSIVEHYGLRAIAARMRIQTDLIEELRQLRARKATTEEAVLNAQNEIAACFGQIEAASPRRTGAPASDRYLGASTPDAWAIISSGFFDPTGYAERVSLKDSGSLAMAQHYIEIGEALRIPPSERFDPAFYAERNPDVAASGMGLLLHYIQFGRNEGRPPKAEA